MSQRQARSAAPRDDAPGAEGMRLDKWLWAARFYKTRSLAAEAIEAGRVRQARQPLKRAHPVRVGLALEITDDPGLPVRLVEVLALPATRRGATETQACWQETPASLAARDAARARRREAPDPAGTRQGGRPTKADRRELEVWQRPERWADT